MTSKRKLFYIERMLFLNGDRSVEPISLVFHGTLKGYVTEDRVKLALDKLQKKHPALRARITEGKYIHYEDTDYPPIPFRTVERVSDHTWKTEKDKYISEPYDFEKGPLVRFLWIKSEEISEFIFTGLHVIIDGKSLYVLMKDFLIFINDPDREPKPYPPILSMKELFPDVSLTWKEKLIGNVYTEFMRGKLFFATWNKKVQPGRSYTLFLILDEKINEAFLKVLEKNKVSAGSISCVLGARLFKTHFHPGKSECAIHMSLDIRRYTPSIKKDMLWGFAPMIRPKIRVSDDMNIWEEARSFENQLIDKAIKEQKTDSHSISRSFKRGIVFCEYYNRIVKLIIKRNLTVNEGQDFTFINLGLFAPPMKSIQFDPSPPESYFPWRNSTVLGMGYKPDMVTKFLFASNENCIRQEKMEVIRSEFEQAIKELIKEDKVKNNNN